MQQYTVASTGRPGVVSIEPLKPLDDDGLPTPEIGAWGEEKYRHVQLYASLFIKSMRTKWDALVYLDLYAGSGRSQIRGTRRIVSASPLLILGMPEAFDKYVFCEEDNKCAEVLEMRCRRDFPNRKVTTITGNANASVDNILAEMPRPGRTQKVLGICFLDPFQMQNLHFETIRTLSQRFMDFLVLIPSSMDANRNEQNYILRRNKTLENFVGNPEWRDSWTNEKARGKSFENFVVEEFGRSMQKLEYIDPGLKEALLIRSDEKNLPLYRLALYSKHKLGAKFWKETKKYSDPQTGFGF
jgi:three-Cys-motif partner protein